MPRTKNSDDRFYIYSVMDGERDSVLQVSDPTRMAILDSLSGGERSASEISSITGKGQSTLAPHLEAMSEQHLISSENDPDDSRRRIYRVSSKRIAESKTSFPEGDAGARSMLNDAFEKETASLYRILLKSTVIQADSNGLELSPMMESIGARLAERMASRLPSKKIEDAIAYLQEFYERNELGEVCIYTFMPLTIIIRDAEEMPSKCRAMASLHHGIFTSLLSLSIGRRFVVAESEIFGTGNNYYKFRIESAR